MQILPSLNKHRVSIVLLILTAIILVLTIYKPSYDKTESVSALEFQPNISITPSLSIDRFAPYTISASNVPETPTTVSLELSVENGDNTPCWDYNADGSCASQPITLPMTYSPEDMQWSNTRIYPDYIYPEIFFASSAITWNNTPLNTSVRRNDYHILHMENPFTMVGDMSFWIELNAVPVSTTNSADLLVYLVEGDAKDIDDITFFNSDWTKNTSVELVGTFDKNAVFHHTHTSNSSHHLIPLTTNPDGSIGTKSLDVSGDFWIVLYSTSPNNNRGWNLRYHPSSICNNTNRWYRANQTGWTTTIQAGCPDTHIHIARRDATYQDQIQAIVKATYEGENSGTFSSEPTLFSFNPIMNLPPTSSSFLFPTNGGSYDNNIEIRWDPASDPNNDPLTYNIFLTKIGEHTTSLVVDSSLTSLILDISSLANGEYTLTGEVCDGTNPCVPFGMVETFVINKIMPIQSLSAISISSSNPINTLAKANNLITLSFSATGEIDIPTVTFYSGGDNVNGGIDIEEVGENIWTASYLVNSQDTSGEVTFTITSTNLVQEYFETLNNTFVSVDLIPPTNVVSSKPSGIYLSPENISLSSTEYEGIRYTTDSSTPTCTNGTEYTGSIELLRDIGIKAVACDEVGNVSTVQLFEYDIKHSLISISIASSNNHNSWAKDQDSISLTFESSREIEEPIVTFASGGITATNGATVINTEGNIWIASYIVDSEDTDGEVSFNISSNDLFEEFTDVTDESSVTVDKSHPTIPVAIPTQGSYTSTVQVTLASLGHSIIRYSLDETIPSCEEGTIYLIPFNISSTNILKAVACDSAGNQSTVTSLPYLITPSIFDENIQEEEDLEEESFQEDQEEENSDITEDVEESVDEESTTQEKEEEEIEIIPEGSFKTSIIRDMGKTYYSEIKFRILNQERNPLEYIKVTMYSEPQTAITNDDGIVNFENVLPGTHTITFEYENRKYSKLVSIANPKESSTERIVPIVEIIAEEEGTPVYVWILLLVVVILLVYVAVTFKERESVKKFRARKSQG